ncbi:hypothetical protein SARC_02124 [Sphaeroforma arctica JP610]|uniref:Uncharacterized protein n=1 Tax=Sphaeroforma arctica JP610 TaxID=667725 RepID=A0A0L0G9Y4_9EUKA|nr:hypothetical protein SARC_02124 [Sphaeroforma arctica JP610]KNC85714.1 hypothetical protein SARC_02124 [Sphaeroforma arctica JP610]|eukprot:XP_014159616.1 hypothetical protein SARC_02124 [Sphaeroforma arctica JP610]
MEPGETDPMQTASPWPSALQHKSFPICPTPNSSRPLIDKPTPCASSGDQSPADTHMTSPSSETYTTTMAQTPHAAGN